MLGLPYDTKIDLWSLGAIIAELHTGYVLFQNDSLAAMLARIIGILGPFPRKMLARGRHTHKFFRNGDVFERENGKTYLLHPKVPWAHKHLGVGGGWVGREAGKQTSYGWRMDLLHPKVACANQVGRNGEA